MYDGPDLSPYVWACLLAFMILAVAGLIGMFLIGVSRAYHPHTKGSPRS